MAIKTTWTEVNQIIKEEFQRLVEKKKIQARIQQINEELAQMEDEDASMLNEGEDTLDEVEAGGEMKVSSHAWTGEEDGDIKWTPKFEKKGSHLLEDEEAEDEMEDEGDDEGSLADEFAELGAAIEAKIMAALGKAGAGDEDELEVGDEDELEVGEDDIEVGDEASEEDFEEVEVDEEEPIEEDAMEEYREVMPTADGGVTTTHDVDGEGKEEVKESLNESVSKTDKKYLNVLSEGLDTRKKNALESEVERMRRLANLGGNND